MKKQFMAFTLALVLCLGLAVPVSAAGFSDVPADHWASEQINRAVADGIVSGYADGSFRPAAPVSYAAFSLMLARAFYPGELAGSSGTREAVMNRHGIWNGTSRVSKSGGADLPREDMAWCIYNLLVDKGAGIPSDTEYLKAMSSISDFYSIDPNCRRGVLVCYTLGLLGGLGDGSFGPQKSMNRAQAAVVIGRLRDYVQDSNVVEIPSGEEPKAPPISETTPEVKDLPAFKLMDGENVQQMMDRINASTTYQEGYLTNGKPITEDNIIELLAKFEETMPEGTAWDESSPYNYQSRSFGWTHACSAFGAAISDALFDEAAPIVRHQNFDQLKVGDVIWVKRLSTGYYHAVVVTSFTLPNFYMESNVYDEHGLIRENADRYVAICNGNSGNCVIWEDVICVDDFYEPDGTNNSWIYSRY